VFDAYHLKNFVVSSFDVIYLRQYVSVTHITYQLQLLIVLLVGSSGNTCM